MERNLWKYSFFLAIGISLLGSTILWFNLGNYLAVLICLFAGILITRISWVNKKCLIRAKSALNAGKDFVIINYKDSAEAVDIKIIPVWSNKFMLYGYLPEKEDVKEFQWRYMMGATINGQQMYVVDVLKYIRDIPLHD